MSSNNPPVIDLNSILQRVNANRPAITQAEKDREALLLCLEWYIAERAGMVESADTTVSNTVAERRAGSTPAPGTKPLGGIEQFQDEDR